MPALGRPGDSFGWSVAVSGGTVVVGASEESSNATGVNGDQNDNSSDGSGAAYVFVRSGTTWSQQAYLKASNTDVLDHFSWAVAVSGNTVVAGAYGEASNATGANGDPNDNSAQASGAAYIFTGFCPGPQLDLLADGNGGYLIRLHGVPGCTYRLQRAPNPTGPWTTSAPQTAPASGLIDLPDLFPLPAQAFYRAVQP